MDKEYDEIVKANVVKYHNDLNLVQFKDFNNRELNLFYSICSVMRDQDESTITFNFKYLKDLAQIKVQNKAEFIELTKGMYDKLINLKFEYEDEHKFVKFVLFTGFVVDKMEEKVSVKVNPDFKYILNNITSNFTRFELQEYNSLKSKYSKEIYRYIKRFRTTGIWRVDTTTLKKILGLPEDFKNKYFNKDIFKIVKEELEPLIANLKIVPCKKGRSIVGYEFRFKKESMPKSVKRNRPPKIITKDAEDVVRERYEKEKNRKKNKFHNFDESITGKYSDEYLENILRESTKNRMI